MNFVATADQGIRPDYNALSPLNADANKPKNIDKSVFNFSVNNHEQDKPASIPSQQINTGQEQLKTSMSRQLGAIEG